MVQGTQMQEAEIRDRSMDTIYHITGGEEWERALSVGTYQGDTLASEGFIHCSTAAQVVPVANAFYRGRTGLVLLCIDSAKVEAEIRYEKGEGEERFPHIYGCLDVSAVHQVLRFEPDGQGMFTLPAEIAGW
jgi:uncharacterized protein (DUF952 family)